MTNPREPDWEAFYQDYRKPGFIPGYEILQKLGGGSFGIVFKARKESIGKDYAAKFLKLDEPGVREAVMRELESVSLFAQIDHPNLVTIEDRGEVHGIPFILMGYAGEDTLRSRLDSGTLTRDEGLRIFVQVARGVKALHDHALVHFDLKPGNVFLRGDIARIGDYGLSKLVSASHNSLSFGRGTPYYMAPELLQRRGDSRSDIYSLGIILYECLAGDVPFRGDSEWEILRMHESEAPHFPDSIDPRCRGVIERCMQKDPAARYQDVQQLLDDLSVHSVAPSGVPKPAEPAARPARRPALAKPLPPAAPLPQKRAEPLSVDRAAEYQVVAAKAALRKRQRRGQTILLLVAIFLLFPLITGSIFSIKSSRSRAQSRAESTDRRASPRAPRYVRSKLPRLNVPTRDRDTRRFVERTLKALEKRNAKTTHAKLVLPPYRELALVQGANELIKLNYMRTNDVRYGKKLHEVLSTMTNFRFRFKDSPSRHRISVNAARANLKTAEQFWNHVRKMISKRK